MTNTAELALGICGLVVTCIGIGIALGMYSRRELQPLKARRPMLSIGHLMTYVILCFATSLQALLNSTRAPCFFNLFPFYADCSNIGITLVRCAFLHYAYQFNLSAMSYDSKKGRAQRMWFLRHKQYFTLRNMGMVGFCIELLLFSLPFMSGDLESKDVFFAPMNSDECRTSAVVLANIRLSQLLLWPVLILMYLFMRRVKEKFKLRQEFKQLALMSLVNIIVTIISGVIFESQTTTASMFEVLIVTFGYYWVIGLNIIRLTFLPEFPPYNSDRRKSTTSVTSKNSAILKEFLDSEIGIKAFKEHAAKEFCVENALFLEAVVDFRKLSIAEEIKAKAILMVNDFIKNDALYCVNISFMARKAILDSELEKLEVESLKTLFDASEREIIDLVCKDTFPRFVKTKAFAEAQTQIQMIKSDDLVLSGLGMA